jgi:hypothetical protein
MSGVLKAIGQVAGIIAMIPGPWQPIAAAVAVVANVGAALLAKKPGPVGASTQITIGGNQPSSQILGRCYSGGARMLQVGYGVEDDVQNAHAAIVDIYSVGGPLSGLVEIDADFAPVTFTATNADGYYHNNFHADTQLGATPEARALEPHWSGTPDWGADYKLSGKAAIFFNARFPKKGDVFHSGFPQTGAVWDGVLAYDPRLDSTYPGGSGSQRWASPADTSVFSAAKPTWVYSQNPGVQGLRYALGTWDRDESNPAATYLLTFGMGLPFDGIIVSDFIELANVCDANGWEVNGIIAEPGDRWENLKNICAAGGAEPCIKGGLLGLRISAPKVSLDTITRDDLADDDITVPATRSYRDRLNTIIPKYKSATHKWEYVASNPVQVLDYVTLDGEVRSEERQYNLVTSADQAAQLAAYDLVNGRERFPIELVCKPRLRLYAPGDQLTVDIPEADLVAQDCVIMRRSVDPMTMKVTLTLMEETAAKHIFALDETGTSPPAISIDDAGTLDGTTYGTPAQISAIIRGAYAAPAYMTAADAGASVTITVPDTSWDYPDGTADVVRTGGTINGCSYSTVYYVCFDDATLANAAPAYVATTSYLAAINSTTHPFRHYVGFIATPAAGGGGTTGGGGGGGYGCTTIESLILMANAAQDGPGDWKRAGDIRAGDWVWTRHENDPDGPWGAYQVEAIRFLERDILSLDGHPDATPEHPFWHDGWVLMETVGTPAGRAMIAHMTIADAHTYVARHPDASADDAGGVLSHNKMADNPDP